MYLMMLIENICICYGGVCYCISFVNNSAMTGFTNISPACCPFYRKVPDGTGSHTPGICYYMKFHIVKQKCNQYI